MPKAKSTRSAAPIRSSDGVCVGQILGADSMILRVHIGEAQAGKRKYEMSTGVNGAPIILSKTTGKWFCLSWQMIIDLAVKAGIDETHTH